MSLFFSSKPLFKMFCQFKFHGYKVGSVLNLFTLSKKSYKTPLALSTHLQMLISLDALTGRLRFNIWATIFSLVLTGWGSWWLFKFAINSGFLFDYFTFLNIIRLFLPLFFGHVLVHHQFQRRSLIVPFLHADQIQLYNMSLTKMYF